MLKKSLTKAVSRSSLRHLSQCDLTLIIWSIGRYCEKLKDRKRVFLETARVATHRTGDPNDGQSAAVTALVVEDAISRQKLDVFKREYSHKWLWATVAFTLANGTSWLELAPHAWLIHWGAGLFETERSLAVTCGQVSEHWRGETVDIWRLQTCRETSNGYFSECARHE